MKYELIRTHPEYPVTKTCGVDRICGCLRKEGYTASYKRVKKIMDELGWSAMGSPDTVKRS